MFSIAFLASNSILYQATMYYHHMSHTWQLIVSDVNLDFNKIHNILQTLDPNKSHGHDVISIRILKLCSSSIFKPLSLKLTNSPNSDTFLDGKRAILCQFIKGTVDN